MDKSFTLQVAGLTRQLPICPINSSVSIAAFIILGDVELTIACATQLLQKCPSFDAILTAEAKGIPLAYEMSRQTGKPYLVARKSKKLYMRQPVVVQDASITTAEKQQLILDKSELKRLDNKRILLLDDVISSGGSLQALQALVAQTTGQVVAKAAVLAEGDAAKRQDIIFLQPLPLFFHQADTALPAQE